MDTDMLVWYGQRLTGTYTLFSAFSINFLFYSDWTSASIGVSELIMKGIGAEEFANNFTFDIGAIVGK